jgi:cytochrome c oxidase assembly protein subunit 15
VVDVFTVSQRAFRTVVGVALGSLTVIIFSGAMVRLTGSGLGCEDWPRCNSTKFVDVSTGHTLIEQANRLFTGVVSMSVIAAVLLAHFRRPLRKDLVRLAWGLVIGVLAQIIIGGIVVLTGLNPYANMAHFLVSLVLVANAFVLYRRSGDQPVTYLREGPVPIVMAIRLVVISCALALITGTVVTATGPHAGDENAVRFGFTLTSVARVHSVTVLITVALIIFLAIRAKQLNGDSSTRDAVQALLLAAVFQGAVGYVQYFNGVPVVLVAVHIVGAIALWFAVCNLAVSPSRGTLS